MPRKIRELISDLEAADLSIAVEKAVTGNSFIPRLSRLLYCLEIWVMTARYVKIVEWSE